MSHRRVPGWPVLLALLGSGCTLDYGKDQTTPADQVPQMVFEGLKQTSVKDGRVLYDMESAHAEVYTARKQMRLKNLRFQEYDSTGQTASVGEAEAAVIDTASNNATISGALTARSEEQGVSLEVTGGEGPGLTWTNDDRILKTGTGAGVVLKKDDGSRVDAKALTLDLGTNRLELEDGVQGTWTPETKNDAKSPPPHDPSPGPLPSPSP